MEPEKSPSDGEPVSLVCIEYPGVVRNVDKMLTTLGGLNTISEVLHEPNRRLELRFRPEDISCKPTCGERSDETGLILKVQRLRRKKKKNQATSGDQFKYVTTVIGAVDVSFKFNNLCDFQYLPMVRRPVEGPNPDATPIYGSIYQSVFFDHLVDSSWLNEASPLFLPPAAFSRMDVPQDYQYRRETAGDKASLDTPYNIIGRTRQRRSHHAIFITFDMEEVPQKARDFAANQLKVKFISPEAQERVRRGFQEQPVWSKNALNAVTGILPDRLKYILPAIAYYFTTGPWRNQWVRFGYDPRKLRTAAQYQTMDYRVRLQAGAKHKVKAKRSYANYLLPYKAMNWSKPKTSVIDRESFSNLLTGEPKEVADAKSAARPAVQDEMTEAEMEIKRDVYVFRPGRIPPYRQMFYQFKDLQLDEVQTVIQDNLKPELNSICDEKNGWYLPGTDQKIRDILTSAISQVISEQRDQELAAGGVRSESVAELNDNEDLNSSEEDEDEEPVSDSEED